MTALYAATIFSGAALLFLVQPMFARALLPLLGGSPGVWNTAMVFFQATLLAGYAYAHWSTTRLGVRRQAAWHLGLLLLPLLVLPVAVPAGWTPPTEDNPVPWLLGLMLVSVGLPFFVVATTSPLLQRWYSALSHRDTADPYFLYVASNAGSMLALLSYPLWFEPRLSLAEQRGWWSAGYGLLVLLVAACAIVLWRRGAAAAPHNPSVMADEPLSMRRRLRWMLLSFAPSSLMLGVTTYFSTEIAVVPLLWIVPLALYLFTFILAFAQRKFLPVSVTRRAFPILLVALLLVLNMLATQPLGGVLALHLGVFFLGALLCHGHLAADRPPVAHLTEFYLWISVGGVLGGVFNGLVAPVVFDSIAEYPIMLVLTCWLALTGGRAPGEPITRADWLWPLVLGAATLGAITIATRSGSGSVTLLAAIFGVAATACFFMSRRPFRFAAAVGALLLAGVLAPGEEGRVLHAERSFFGVHRVTRDADGRFNQLIHGMTLHGRQSLDPRQRQEPLTYYHRTGPAGDVLAGLGIRPDAEIGVVGLGAGSLAAFAQPTQHWTFYEIDPVVVKLARDPRYFSYLDDAAAEMRTVLGDARRSLQQEPAGRFDLIVLDAYSSDAIPVHLVTAEAVALYMDKLKAGGRLAFHISNVYLDLEPVFGNIAAHLGLVAVTRTDPGLSAADIAAGKAASAWVVMARTVGDLGGLQAHPHWTSSRRRADQRVWTDDYSSLIQVLIWQ